MSAPTEEQINHLQSLLDAGTPGEWTTEGVVVWTDEGLEIGSMDRDAGLVCNLHNLAPALLEAARENLRLREALENWNRVYLKTECEYDDCQGALKVAYKALGKETV